MQWLLMYELQLRYGAGAIADQGPANYVTCPMPMARTKRRVGRLDAQVRCRAAAAEARPAVRVSDTKAAQLIGTPFTSGPSCLGVTQATKSGACAPNSTSPQTRKAKREFMSNIRPRRPLALHDSVP